MSEEALHIYNQENICTLLAFDKEYFQLVRNSISPELFNPPYSKVIERLCGYIDKYKQPPMDHTADELADLIDQDDGEKYRDVLLSIYTAKEHFNAKYVTDKLKDFLRKRKFQLALYEAAALANNNKLDEAQAIMDKAKSFELSLFDPGLKITDFDSLIASLEDSDTFPTGIEVLDRKHVGPARGQVLIVLGVKKTGKSHFGVQIGIEGAKAGNKIAHVTLELQARYVHQRYIQSLCGLTRWEYNNTITSPVFKRDGNGDIVAFGKEIINPKCLTDPNIVEHIKQTLRHTLKIFENNIRIKEFPTGTLTVPELEAYLENLEMTENFIADEVIIDMPINMRLVRDKDFRHRLSGLFVDLRGLAGRRNLAIVGFHHINREGAKSKSGGADINISEDWNILGIIDTGITYARKKSEAEAGLARLTVDTGRSVEDGFSVLIAQSIPTGHFSIDSELLPKTYDPEGPAVSPNVITLKDDND